MRETDINAVLSSLNGGLSEIEASFLVSLDGLIMASALAPGMDETQTSALVAAVLTLGAQIAAEVQRGALEQVLITGTAGHILIQQAGDHAVLCTVAGKTVKLGLLFLDTSRAAQAVKALLQ